MEVVVSSDGGENTILTPADLPREIEYDAESDTLWIGNGKPAPGGMDLFPGCIVFFDGDGRTVSGVMLQGARHLLGPYLYDGSGQDGGAE